MNTTLKALVQRIWRRAYLDTEEECARWIEEYIQTEQLHKPDVSVSVCDHTYISMEEPMIVKFTHQCSKCGKTKAN